MDNALNFISAKDSESWKPKTLVNDPCRMAEDSLSKYNSGMALSQVDEIT